jgi:outer membrane protein assembly factor BamE (lipoprotein component of BamABCDE complex)
LLAAIWIAGSANADALADASRSYKERGDYASLKIIAAHLRKGMSRQEVEALLGSPDLEPTSSQSYYGSDRREQPDWADRELWVTLVIDYESGAVTARVQSWEIGPVGE